MTIVYESKTGFTKQYADMLAVKTGFNAVPAKRLSEINKDEEIIFLGWLKVGLIQGLKKSRNYKIKAICATGTGRTAEPDTKTVLSGNNIIGTPFFYLRGGCYPLKKLKGMDKFLLSAFVRMLKKRKDRDERVDEAISIIENGFNGVNEESLLPVLEWIKENN